MPRGPVPLQLPASTLPKLNQLGIYPVPSGTSPATPAPAAVLLGTLAGGTTLSLEINLAALQPAQMTGLAEMLTAIAKPGAAGAAAQSQGLPPVQPYAQIGAPYVYPGANGAGVANGAAQGASGAAAAAGSKGSG